MYLSFINVKFIVHFYIIIIDNYVMQNTNLFAISAWLHFGGYIYFSSKFNAGTGLCYAQFLSH